MKTRVLTVLGTLAMGALAAGCSAETAGKGGDPSVGETRGPLVAADITAARKETASCVITESGIDKILVAGGRDSSGTISSAVYLYNPADDSWSTKDSLPTATTGGEMISIPGTDKCLYVGGTQGANVVNTSYLYDLSDDAGGSGWSTVDTMLSARKDFKLTLCGNGTGTSTKILAIGGVDNAAGYPVEIEVFTASDNQWNKLQNTGVDVTLGVGNGRSKLSVAALNTSYDKFIVAAGQNAGTQKATLNLLTFTDTSCGGAANATAGNVLRVARSEAVAFPTGETDKFYVTGGTSNGSNVLATSEYITVNWGGGSATEAGSAGTPGGTSLTTARRRPRLMQYSATKVAVVGGLNASGDPVKNVQPWQTGATPAWLGDLEMTTARYDFSGEYSAYAERAFVVGGANSSDVAIVNVESL